MGNRNSGPRPSPNSLKLLKGTRKDRLNPREPIPQGDVVRPGTLTVRAVGIWDEIAPLCLQMGTLTAADVPAFARMCELQATVEAASAAKDQPEFAYMKDGRLHPALKLERETATALRPFYDYFGMTPSGRARLQVSKPEEPVSKWAGALA